MPGRQGVRDIDTSLCRRCQTNGLAVTVRSEPLCKDCFCKYATSKIIKRMESFRVRHSTPGEERTILLPLSFGAGSTALLHVLSAHLKGQVEKSRRTGFRLHVLNVNDDTSTANFENEFVVEKVKQKFPDHSYSTVLLSDVFTLDNPDSLMALVDGSSAHISSTATNEERLNHFFASFDSATSRTDAKQNLRRRLIVRFAKKHNCEAIVWGDSTTRLAERTLAETAKGRGFSLPWIVADGESPHGIPFYYPMRELLSKEISAFASLVDPPLNDIIIKHEAKTAVSIKDTSIDDLMQQYFASVEREYPSIVANVVKTTGKLQAAPLSHVEMQCELCDMPLDGQAPERSRLCYGCIRTLPSSAG